MHLQGEVLQHEPGDKVGVGVPEQLPWAENYLPSNPDSTAQGSGWGAGRNPSTPSSCSSQNHLPEGKTRFTPPASQKQKVKTDQRWPEGAVIQHGHDWQVMDKGIGHLGKEV